METISLYLDGKVGSPLRWKEAFDQAKEAAACGKKLLWYFDLGLFHCLPFSLSDLGQLSALTLACEYFAERMEAFELGGFSSLVLYEGVADLSHAFCQDARDVMRCEAWLEVAKSHDTLLAEELQKGMSSAEQARLWRLFCRDIAAEYLGGLVAHLPDDLPIKVALRWPKDLPFQEALTLSSQEAFPHIDVTIQGGPCGMETPGSLAELGLVWPRRHLISLQHYSRIVQQAFALAKGGRSWRIVPEPCITNFWHGLDEMFVDMATISPEGKRMLEGFAAAGGKISYC